MISTPPDDPRWLRKGRATQEQILERFKGMQKHVKTGKLIVIVTYHAAQPGDVVLQGPEGRVVIDRRATRDEYTANRPDGYEGEGLRGPFYYTAKIQYWDRIGEALDKILPPVNRA